MTASSVVLLAVKVNTRGSALYINGQEAVQFLPVPLITRYLGLGVFLSPRVMCVRHTLHRKFIEGNQGSIFTDLCRFF